MEETESLKEYCSKIETGDYTLLVVSTEFFDNYGEKQRRALETRVMLMDCLKASPSAIESRAVKNKLLLMKENHNLYGKSRGYARKLHNEAVKRVNCFSNPKVYRMIVKKDRCVDY